MSKQFTLSKNERLKKRKLIEQLFTSGKSFSVFPFKIIYLITSISEDVLQAGFGVSRRNFKKAVDRNRIRRLTKEAYRLQKQQLKNRLKEQNRQLAVFLIYTGKELPDYTTVSEKLKVILNKLRAVIDEDHSPNT